jgi:hypothetical protein
MNLRVVLKLGDGVTTSRAMVYAIGRPHYLPVRWLPQDRQFIWPDSDGVAHRSKEEA